MNEELLPTSGLEPEKGPARACSGRPATGVGAGPWRSRLGGGVWGITVAG